jgi:hypothetical protein
VKTLEDKLRELSMDELNKWTIKYIIQLQNVDNEGIERRSDEDIQHYWKDKEVYCKHCGGTYTRVSYAGYHGDKCIVKSLDVVSFKKDYEENILSKLDLRTKYGISEWSYNNIVSLFKEQGILSQRVPTNRLPQTCKHCGVISTKSNIIQFHNDKCKLKGRFEEFKQDVSDGMTNIKLGKKYHMSNTTIPSLLKQLNLKKKQTL